MGKATRRKTSLAAAFFFFLVGYGVVSYSSTFWFVRRKEKTRSTHSSQGLPNLDWKVAQPRVGIQEPLGDQTRATPTSDNNAANDELLPPPLSETFSACILTMDDYPILSEWISYHYHALPLRHIIAAVDPRSTVSPTPIFDIWRERGVTIEEWSDEDFAPLFVNHPLPVNASAKKKFHRHRDRQKRFYQACCQSLQKQNRTWTTMHDTDEFIRLNTDQKMKLLGVPHPLPSIQQPGIIMRVLKEGIQRDESFAGNKSACISIPRVLYSSKEINQEEQQNEQAVPEGFHSIAHSLETMRYRYHNKLKGPSRRYSGLAKCILDVSKLHTGFHVQGVHRPVLAYCPDPFAHPRDTVFVINHYLGTWERYAYRDDARAGSVRCLEAFEERSNMQTVVDQSIRDWLDGFVKAQGQDMAFLLLSEVGVFPGRNGTGLKKSYPKQEVWRKDRDLGF
eukprot:scaffold1663_cov171-Amphora_coffeaeformis.AAC.9